LRFLTILVSGLLLLTWSGQMTITQSALGLVAVAMMGLGALVGLTEWPVHAQTLNLAGLALAATAVASFDGRRSYTSDADAMQPSFVLVFVAMLLIGPLEATVVAAATGIAHGLAAPAHARRAARTLEGAITGATAMYAAGAAYQALGGNIGAFEWPRQGLSIAAAVAAYCLVSSTSARLLIPLIGRQRVKWTWLTRMGRTAPPYVVGAALSIGIAEMVSHQYWEIVPVAIVPAVIVYLGYHDALSRFEDACRRREVTGDLVQGMAVVDHDGAITLWNEALERLLNCPRELAVGNALVVAVPAFSRTDLTRAVDAVLTDRTPRTLPRLVLPVASGSRTAEVRIVPVEGGAALLWHDITELTREEEALKRSEQRLALAPTAATTGGGSGTCGPASATSPAAGGPWSGCPGKAAPAVPKTGWDGCTAPTHRRCGPRSKRFSRAGRRTSRTSTGSATRMARIGGSTAVARPPAVATIAPSALPGR
jgi:PAS domain-containing protein